jgi:hypothetical protein
MMMQQNLQQPATTLILPATSGRFFRAVVAGVQQGVS